MYCDVKIEMMNAGNWCVPGFVDVQDPRIVRQSD